MKKLNKKYLKHNLNNILLKVGIMLFIIALMIYTSTNKDGYIKELKFIDLNMKTDTNTITLVGDTMTGIVYTKQLITYEDGKQAYEIKPLTDELGNTVTYK